MKWVTMLLVAAFATVASAGSFTISVVPSSAPNVFGSPSFGTYQSNAMYALENGLTSYGDPTSPTYYQKISGPVSVESNIVTNFNSWDGHANPSGAFGSEEGNRGTFGLHITSNDGSQFSISQLSFTGMSDDTTHSLNFGFGVDTYQYSPAYVGIDYVDGIKGNGDDKYITSGENTQLVNELVGRGSGNAWQVIDDTFTSKQNQLDNGANAVWAGRMGLTINFTGTYTLGNDASGSATIVFDKALEPPLPASTATPLPSVAMGGGVLFSLGLFRRGKRRR